MWRSFSNNFSKSTVTWHTESLSEASQNSRPKFALQINESTDAAGWVQPPVSVRRCFEESVQDTSRSVYTFREWYIQDSEWQFYNRRYFLSKLHLILLLHYWLQETVQIQSCPAMWNFDEVLLKSSFSTCHHLCPVTVTCSPPVMVKYDSKTSNQNLSSSYQPKVWCIYLVPFAIIYKPR